MATAFENLAPRIIADLIRDFGLTPSQAAGILGNLEAESGVRAIGEAGGKGPGFGWAQWSFARRTAFLNWCSDQHFDAESYEANYGYLREELSGNIKGYNYSGVIDKLKTSNSPEQAAQIFCDNYEKPNRQYAQMPRRLASARKALLLYQARGFPTVPVPKEVSPVSPTTDTKPWYLSKGVIGGIIAIVLPLLSAAIPALRLVNPETATGAVMKILEIAGPVFGGILAIVGRISATQPIAGTKAAKTGFALPAPPSPSAGSGILGLPLDTILSELPIVISALSGLKLNGIAAAAHDEDAFHGRGTPRWPAETAGDGLS